MEDIATTDRGFLAWINDSVVYGDICDSCGEFQTINHSGLHKVADENLLGDWLLCEKCHKIEEDEGE